MNTGKAKAFWAFLVLLTSWRGGKGRNMMLDYSGCRHEMVHFLPHTACKSVLEIGCGLGGFRNYLPTTCEYWGVDPHAPSQSSSSCQSNKVMFLTGTYEEVCQKIPNRFFDLVICNDVIEHMAKPEQFLESIKAKLSDGGVIIGSIPNVRHLRILGQILLYKDWHYTDWGILDRTHLRFFTMKSFRRMVVQAGYEIVTLKGLYKGKFTGVYKYLFWLQFIPALFLGFDTPYSQFGFSIKPVK